MKARTKKQQQDPVPVTIWLNTDTLEKLNQLVLAESTTLCISNRSSVIRRLIEKEKK